MLSFLLFSYAFMLAFISEQIQIYANAFKRRIICAVGIFLGLSLTSITQVFWVAECQLYWPEKEKKIALPRRQSILLQESSCLYVYALNFILSHRNDMHVRTVNVKYKNWCTPVRVLGGSDTTRKKGKSHICWVVITRNMLYWLFL